MSDNIIDFLVGIVVGVIISSLVFLIIVPNEMLSYKEDAIKAGVGEYNPKTGKFQFKALAEGN